jgi:hypothetical protein
MESYQTARTRSVNGLAGAMEVIEPADAVCHDGWTSTRSLALQGH